MTYIEKTFDIPENLTGISATNIAEHLKLYSGYVKYANLITDHLKTFAHEFDVHSYEIGELRRRFSFEYNGMRNHEYYFEQLVGGARALSPESKLFVQITEQFGSFEIWQSEFEKLAMTRGIGWAIMYYDAERKLLINNWVNEQHLGHLNSCQFVCGIDIWEHAYVADYQPSGKKQYVADYLANMNWDVVADRFENVMK